MGKKAFPSRRSSSAIGLPDRVLAAAGLLAHGGGRDRIAAVPLRRRIAGPPWPIVLGIDPGTRIVGYGAILAHRDGPRYLDAGAIRTSARAGVPQRLSEIQGGIAAILERIRPTVVVVERAFASRNVQSALRIGEGRGVALACAAAFGAEVVELPPAVAKKALVGHGAADKGQVARMVGHVLGLREGPTSLDATDALALALAHLFQSLDCRADGRREAGGARPGGTARTRGARGAPGGVRGGSLEAAP